MTSHRNRRRHPGGRPAVGPKTAGPTAVVLAAMLAVGVGGCGIGVQDHPTVLPSAGPTWRPSHTVASPTAGLAIQVFLVRRGHLVRVWRKSGGQGLDDVIAALLQSPSPQDRAAGLGTEIPSSVHRLRASVRGAVVRLQVPPAFDALPSQQRVLAVAQLVYTLTAQLPVHGLRLMVGGRAVDTPVGSGRLVARPVTRTDFAALAPSVS